MAMIRSFEKVNPGTSSRHRATDDGYRWFDVSQTIQVDRDRAAELKKVLEQAFPGV